jgi:HlyD family secretion protein
MRQVEGRQERGRGARQWENDSHADRLGPQGAALILELQRLRREFDEESRSGLYRGSAPGGETGPRRRPSAPKRRKKNRMSKAIELCLQQFRLKAAGPTGSASEALVEAITPPPRRESPMLAPRDPLTMDLTSPLPELFPPGAPQQAVRIKSPRLLLPRAASPQTTTGKLVDCARTGLVAGVGFLVRGEPAPKETATNLATRARWAFDNELRTGLRMLIAATVLGGGWFVFVPLAGAVVVPGNLVVESNVKAIQHPTGGIVAEIKVQNGTRVNAGDLLVRLDATQAQASLQVISKQLNEVRAKIARLAAERDGVDQLEIPAELKQRAANETVTGLFASEESLFKARLTGRQSQKDLLQSRIAQLSEEISGLEAQVASKSKQLELISGELTGVQELYDKHLVPLARLTALQRESARIDGERGQLASTIAETKSKIGEAQLQIVRLDQDFRTDVVKELGEAQAKEAELIERGVAARDLLERIEMRAPTSGVIHQLAVHTIGGVIRAGDTIMEVVPDTDDLQIEARLQPADIDRVHTGQKAFVRFTSFNQRTTPQLTGTVSYVSADTSQDQHTNASYFTVRIILPDDERRRLSGQQLVAGMPAEVFMQTGSRTMMSYLFKPIIDQMSRAFVEQ